MKSVIFRADGNNKVGMGHVIRCLSLADEIKASMPDINITFVTKDDIAKKAIEEKYHKVFLTNNIDFFSDNTLTNKLIITDFLNTDNKYISKIREITGDRSTVLCIDNNPVLKYIDAQIVVNANVFSQKETFGVGSTLYYLGPKYMILKKTFEKLRTEKNEIRDSVNSILVMMGGSDPNGFTVKLIKILQKIPKNMSINIVLGPAFDHFNLLNKELDLGNRDYNIYHNPRDLSTIMKNADIALSAAGITLYELATLGIPTIAIPQVKHQEYIAEAFEKKRACINTGYDPDEISILKSVNLLMENSSLRAEMKENSRNLVDGKGLKRVASMIENIL